MPVDYTLKNGGAFVHVRAWGDITTEEVGAFLVRLGDDPGLLSDHVTLFDATQARTEVLEDIHFQQALEIEKSRPDKLVARKMAIVVARKNELLNAMRYESVSAEIGEPVKIFFAVADAMLWLAL